MSDPHGEPDSRPESFPLLPEDPPSVGGFWLDARLSAQPSGVSFLAHDDDGRQVVIVLLSEGAAGDAAARDRLAGMVNRMYIDDVIARGGQGQDTGRLARRYRVDNDAPVSPQEAPNAPWVALAYDPEWMPQVAEEMLTEVSMALLPQQGNVAGPDYQHYWIDRIHPGRSRIWPLPWPGRHDRAGWVTILVSWVLMLLLAALGVLIAILLFRNEPPQAPPPPVPQTATEPQSGSPPPDSASPSPDSASPSPESGSPSPESGSPSPESGSPSPESGSPSPSGTMPGEPSPRSRL